MDLKARAKELKTDIPAIFLTLKDKETPLLAKVFAGITITYALSPKDVFQRNKKRSEGMWEKGKPKKWYYAIPIVLLWGLIILWITGNLL